MKPNFMDMKHLAFLKKSFLILFFQLIIMKPAEAQQPWSEAGAKWHYTYESQLAFGYLKIEKIKDTIFNGFLCDKYEISHHTFAMPGIYQHDTSYAYTYISNDSLYFSRGAAFFPYANFSVQVGDTISTEMYPGIGCGANHFTVDSLGSWYVNNDTLEVIYLTPTVTGYAIDPLRLIEKIGFNQQQFEPWPCMVDMPFAPYLRCYSDNSGFSYSTLAAPACDYISGINSLQTNKPAVYIFPNPASNELTLEFPNLTSTNCTLGIYDLFGNEIRNQKIESNTSKMDVSQLSPSIYFYKIFRDAALISIGKFSISR